MIRTLIVDDEPIARRRIRRLLQSEPDIEVVGECGDGRSAIESIRTLEPDLVFLDVQMPEADGFSVLRALGKHVPAIVFVTAFDEYALAAFEVHALDYLLKPFNRKRLEESVARARAHLAKNAGQNDRRLRDLLDDLRNRGPKRRPARFVARGEGRVHLVNADAVDWIEAADNYVVLHTGATSHAVRDTMSRLEQELDAEAFVRVHRSTIVRIDRVRELLPSFHGDFIIVLHDGTRLAMSRTYRQRVEQVLGRRL